MTVWAAAASCPVTRDEPDGLTWDQLTAALAAAVSTGGCAGVSVTIYDPEQDPDRSGARSIVNLIREVVRARE